MTYSIRIRNTSKVTFQLENEVKKRPRQYIRNSTVRHDLPRGFHYNTNKLKSNSFVFVSLCIKMRAFTRSVYGLIKPHI